MIFVGFRSDLGGEQLVEEVGVGNFLFGRLLQARGEFVLDLIKPEPMAVVAQALELRSAHHAPFPSLWLTAAYSARSRTMTLPSRAKLGSKRDGAASGTWPPIRNNPP
jgi:hypothetical protein